MTAEQLLERFAPEVNRAVRQVCTVFRGCGIDKDDVRQEAMIRVAIYGGLMKGWHAGSLAAWESMAEDDHAVHLLLGRTLRLDLMQTIGRQIAPETPVALDGLLPGQIPSVSFESGLVAILAPSDGMREAYPFLCARVLDGLTEDEIARGTGVPKRTVSRHLAGERAAFTLAYIAGELAALCTRSANSRGARAV